MISYKQLQQLVEDNNTRIDSPDKSIISSLLEHIQQVEEETTLRYRIAYEVMYIERNSSWRYRTIVAVFWRKDEAKKYIENNNLVGHHASRINIVKVNHKWYMINVNPYDHIIGDIQDAAISRIEYKNVSPPQEELE